MATPNALESSADRSPDRGSLAIFNAQLALDRTTLAWIRTALAMASFGCGIVGFFRTLQEKAPSEATARLHQGAIKFGVGLIVLGLTATILASISHWRNERRLRLGLAPAMRHASLSVLVALLLGILCLGGLWDVLAH